MAQISRPTKQGNATTYQGKVAAGYTKILASEMDADLDLIYSAWNQGVDASNIQPGVITGSMLAPGTIGTRELQDGGIQTIDLGDGQVTTPKIGDGQVTANKLSPTAQYWTLAGNLLRPSDTTKVVKIPATSQQLIVGPGTIAGILEADATGAATLSANQPWVPQDATKPSWAAKFDPVADEVDLFHRVANAAAGTVTTPFKVKGSDGKTYCTLADRSVLLAALGVGAAVQALTILPMAAAVNLDGTERLLVDLTWTSRGGEYFVVAAFQGHIGIPSSGPQTGAQAVLRLDGTAGVVDGTPVANATMGSLAVATGITVGPLTLVLGVHGNSLSSAQHRMKLTAFVTGQVLASCVAESGFVLLGELA